MRTNEAKVALVALLNEYQAAELLGVSVDTLRRWRRLGVGPAFRKLGSSIKAPVRYAPGDLAEYTDGCRRTSTSGHGPVAA